MTDEAHYAKGGFDDIEMLDIPSDSDESVTDSYSAHSGSLDPVDVPAVFGLTGKYCLLQEWLNSDTDLEFKFETNRYQQSQSLFDLCSRAYFQYIDTLYKALEALSNEDITVLSLGRELDQSALREKYSRIDYSFERIVEAHRLRLDTIPQDTDAYDKLSAVSSVLECIFSNYFCPELRYKPDKIADWINRFDPKPYSEVTTEIVVQSPIPYLHPEFWATYLSQLITRGLTSTAADALAHSKYDELEESCPQLYAAIAGLQELLREYTAFSLKGKFNEWKLAACEFRENLPSSSDIDEDETHQTILIQLRDLAYIISGFQKTIALSCENWYEVYTALTLYQVRDDETIYPEYFDMAVGLKPPAASEPSSHETRAEACFLKVMEQKFVNVLNYLFDVEPATAAFVSKCLELKGFLKDYYSDRAQSLDIPSKRRTVSEYFLTIFALECLNCHQLAPVGIGLLVNDDVTVSSHSREKALRVLLEFIPHYDCQTNDDAEWLLTICRVHKLYGAEQDLYYSRGLKSLEQGLLYEALQMFVDCYDPTKPEEGGNKGMKQVHSIVWDTIFLDSLLNNRSAKDDTVNSIVSLNVDEDFEIHPVIRQCISPYAVLFQFYELLQEGNDNEKMISRLNHLLRFQHLPKKFVPLLLCQFISVLLGAHGPLPIREMISIIDVIETHDGKISDEEKADQEELYRCAIENIEADAAPYDWRLVLPREGLTVPKNMEDMVRLLRRLLTSKIGQAYVL